MGENFNNMTYLKGKGIKYSVLVDRKNNLKVIPYNLDYLTFLLGGIGYLFRKQILKSISLLCIQMLCIYILDIPIGIILNFIITFIFSMFSGKSYTNKLIREGAIPFDEYKENGYTHEYDENIALSRATEKRGSKMLQDYKNSIKRQDTIFYCVGSLILVSIVLLTGFEMKLRGNDVEQKTMTTKPSEDSISKNKKIKMPSEFLVLLTDDRELDSLALIKFDDKKCKLNGKYYNGQVLVKQDNKSIPLSEVFKDKGIIPKNILKKYFEINKDLIQIKVDINKAKELLPKIENDEIEDKYRELLIKSAKLDDEKYEELIEEIYILNYVDGEVEEDYLDDENALGYKQMILDSKGSLDIKKGNYYEIALNAIASNSVIESLGDDIKENVLYYLHYIDLDYNNLVQRLREKSR